MSEIKTDMPADVMLESVRENTAASATPLRLMWWKFKRHKVALWSGYFLVFAYFVMATAGFWAPSDPAERSRQLYAPPQWIKVIGPEGELRRPFVYGYTMKRDLNTLRPVYTRDESQIYPIEFFVKGSDYDLFGLLSWDRHFFGVSEGYIYIVGTDSFGRDMFTRLIYGARITLSVGLISVALSLILGLVIGGISGLYGGWIDSITQRVIEAIIAIPTIPLWLGLAAAVPRSWPPVYQYFAILVVLSLISWTSTARVARGRFLAMREQDFVIAARVYGCSQARIIRKHLIPNIMSYVIVTITLAIPTIIIGETALSFLGVGLRAPTVSWGVLLQEAQKIQVIQFYPWLWIGPAVCVIVIVLAFNFVGDGARDAADPFSK